MAKPKPSKYSRARIRSKVRRPKRAGASRGWVLATAGIAVVGVLLVFLSYQERQEASASAPKLGDHWHAYLGVNACGTWQPAVPMFEGRDGSADPNASPRAGIHSHADFLIHDHPFSSDEAGEKATLGKYLDYAQTEISATSIDLWTTWAPGVSYQNGEKCADSKKPGVLQWKVGRYQQPWPEKARTGNPADYHIEDGDIIAVYFLPKGATLEEPPGSQAALSQITDTDTQLPTTSTSAPPTSDSTAPAGETTTSTSSSPAGGTGSSTP